MRGTIKKLCGASFALVLLSLSSYYFGSRYALSHAPLNRESECAMCFGVGDEWKILAGLLLVVALAVAFAAGMMWLRERRDEAPTSSIIS